MELRIYNPQEDGFVQKIEWNYEELKTEVAAAADEYAVSVYTDETIKQAKADRAKLNKFVDALKGKRTEIYVSTPLVECEKRDVKGLYAKARRGEIKNFTGISAPFEAPEHPALSLDTSKLSLEESVNTLLELVLPIVGKKGEKI